jgi:hypothetical protein
MLSHDYPNLLLPVLSLPKRVRSVNDLPFVLQVDDPKPVPPAFTFLRWHLQERGRPLALKIVFEEVQQHDPRIPIWLRLKFFNDYPNLLLPVLSLPKG